LSWLAAPCDPACHPVFKPPILSGVHAAVRIHQANGKGMGFNPAATEIQDEIFRSGEIPVELLARFNRDFILLQPPTLEEFQRWIEDIHRDLKIDPPEAAVDLASEAVRSGLNTRWLEVYVSRLLMKHQPWIGDHPIDEHPDILF
jgi:hypothetical protein